MRTFDFAPLYRGAVGFDRLLNVFENIDRAGDPFVLVLNHREVKLKKSLVQILCGLATFDNAFLVATFFMFTMPQLSDG